MADQSPAPGIDVRRPSPLLVMAVVPPKLKPESAERALSHLIKEAAKQWLQYL